MSQSIGGTTGVEMLPATPLVECCDDHPTYGYMLRFPLIADEWHIVSNEMVIDARLALLELESDTDNDAAADAALDDLWSIYQASPTIFEIAEQAR